MVQSWKLLGKILEEMKYVTPDSIKSALKKQMAEPGKRLGEILVEMKVVTSAQITEALAKQHNIQFVDISTLNIPQDIIRSVLPAMAKEHKILPIKKNGKVLTIAMSDPLDLLTLDNLRFALNMDMECVLSPKDVLEAAIEKHYGKDEEISIETAIEQAGVVDTDLKVRTEDLDATGKEDDAPVIKFVQLMIAEAVKVRASDIHVEPMENRLRIRFRVDGVCHEAQAPPKRLQGSILSRIKIMADMDIAEKRKPQDGRIRIAVLNKELDIRVSSIPATHGEGIVMRLLDKQTGLVSLEELGFHTSDYKRFRAIIKRPNGIFLVTGPTGSGKTTTLYAALKELNRPDVKIITAENPVEYNLAGINQVQVKAQIGLTFGRILRAMLRQAPNIILVGEIRDAETAEIAIQAALTGHLVFSTLHTNDAPGALTRLIDMGVKPFLVASSIQAVMAQRLIRILCPKCKEPYTPEQVLLSAIGLEPKDIKGKTLYKAVGCKECKDTGFRGRKGIFELMELTSEMREMVFKREPVDKLREVSRMNGMVVLLEDGVRKFLDGLTTIEEIISITHREDITY